VDPELQQALAQFEGRLNARIDGVETRLRSYIEERSEALKAYVEERGETTETKLLTAFHNWAQTFEVRARGTSAAVREFDERLGMIEERLAKIERSRN
jgi:DNA anti-recombination protein RmuC